MIVGVAVLVGVRVGVLVRVEVGTGVAVPKISTVGDAVAVGVNVGVGIASGVTTAVGAGVGRTKTLQVFTNALYWPRLRPLLFSGTQIFRLRDFEKYPGVADLQTSFLLFGNL